MVGIASLKNIEDLKGRNVFILFGKTRAGKSTFINDAYQKPVVTSTQAMTSDTNAISYVTDALSINGRKIVLVDTIGLGGSEDEHDRMSFAGDWVRIFSPGGDSRTGSGGTLRPTVKGFLYFIDITDAAGLNEDNRRNLDMFKAMIGDKVLGSVVFVTTKWAKRGYDAWDDAWDDQDDRFEQWQYEINRSFPGASIVRLDEETSRCSKKRLDRMSPSERERETAKYHRNAMRVLSEVMKTEAQDLPQVQEEIADGGEGLTIGGLTLGSVIEVQLKKDAERADRIGMTDAANQLKSKASIISALPIALAGVISQVFDAATEILKECGEWLASSVQQLIEFVSTQF
ncbi:hypothetical protein DL96DRAFT_1581028 [Flagelloscypha sp. PMI_526]|nr:hypothetical protein DL96DRAFT_1581028 [Flagelloscypha sp. PMI_526]